MFIIACVVISPPVPLADSGSNQCLIVPKRKGMSCAVQCRVTHRRPEATAQTPEDVLACGVHSGQVGLSRPLFSHCRLFLPIQASLSTRLAQGGGHRGCPPLPLFFGKRSLLSWVPQLVLHLKQGLEEVQTGSKGLAVMREKLENIWTETAVSA